jgi:Flp pilus assembly protein TadD
MGSRLLVRCLMWLMLATVAGCNTAPRSDTGEDTIAVADAMVVEATALMATDPQRAAELLDRALAINAHDARAHNNRGVLHLQAGSYFDAANAFDTARRLMPSHPGPRVNLGLLLERAGRIDDAIAEYRKAIEVADGHMPAVQALARCQVRNGRGDDDTIALLRTIGIRGSDETWRGWAARTLAKYTDGLAAAR